jgi:hypothetical protein
MGMRGPLAKPVIEITRPGKMTMLLLFSHVNAALVLQDLELDECFRIIGHIAGGEKYRL